MAAGDSIECGGQQSVDWVWSNQPRDMRERDRVGKRNPAKAGIKFVHFGGILQTAGDREDRGAV